nr:linear amide C-N hydrolase [uncultured Holdemanella sp.]
MCTALSFNQFFGRNLDYEFSYGEQVAVTPRNYDFHFRHLDKHESHYAIVGMAHVFEEYPLYYDAMNEKGLGMQSFMKSKKKRTMLLPLNLFLGSYRNVQVSKRQESY